MVSVIRKLKESKSKFIKVRCPKCKNEQVIFGKAASNIKCLVCENNLADATGGKTKIKSRILELLG
jgi:small subunit ribosomal protein S27e